MWEKIRSSGRVAWALMGLVGLLVVLVFVARFLHVIWLPLILAGMIVFLLNPIVSWLARRGVPRVVGTGLTYIFLAGVVVATAWFVVPFGSDQATALQEEFDEERVEELWNNFAETSESWGPLALPTWSEVQDAYDLGGGSSDSETPEDTPAPAPGEDGAEVGDEAPTAEDLQERIKTAREILTEVFEVALILFIAPIIAFYLLMDLPHIRRVAESLIPKKIKPEVMLVGTRLNRAIGGFLRGQLMVALMVGIMCSIGLWIIGLRAWLIVGMVAGLFNLVPLIGPWVGAVPGISLALIDGDVTQAIWVGVIMAGVQQIDNHLISPLVMQRAVNLHPAAVMIALLAGESLLGFVGLLFAVPTAASLKIICSHLWRTYILGEPLDVLAAEWGEAGEKPPMVPVTDLSVT
jgi:predicted PurR-regulated permease PerM